MAPEMQVKQFVAEVNGLPGFRFRVFTTGSDAHYLFVEVDRGHLRREPLQFPVRKSDLRPGVRSALAHGWGHAPRREVVA